MTLDHARSTILAALGRMNAAYAQPVFDEWVLVSVKPDRGAILSYTGPRAEKYKQSFTTDIQPLRTELEGGKLATGDFAFAPAASGTRHDACMRLGGVSYLFCNNTAKSMSDIRTNPLWREAQKPFVELSEKFRADPLE
jgi:hypothetical protein